MKRILSFLAVLLCLVARSQPNIVQVEYFLDADPGLGNGVAISIAPGTDLSNQTLNIDPSSLSGGIHFVGIRAKDATGVWGYTQKLTFLKPFTTNTTVGAVPNINSAEYFLDADPGLGNGVAINITLGTDLSNQTLNIDPSSLSGGIHIAGIRAKDANGVWSYTQKLIFLKPFTTNTTVGVVPNISSAEYYFDTDPGFDKATAFTITPGTDLLNQTINVDPTNLSQGIHTLGLRAKDANGAWSLSQKWTFIKIVISPQIVPATRTMQKAEYYIDHDPGIGNGTAITIPTNTTDLSNIQVPADMTGLDVGNHTFYIRGQDNLNAWSLVDTFRFNVPTSFVLPVTGLFFTGNVENYRSILRWATATEINSKQFLVQRSVDGVNFATIGNVAAAGNSNVLLTYEFDDDITSLNNYRTIYYRLQEVDVDGKSTYSTIVALNMNQAKNQLSLLTNPVQSTATLHYGSLVAGKITMNILDETGKLISTKAVDVQLGANQIILSTSELMHGIYIIEAASGTDKQFVRMLK